MVAEILKRDTSLCITCDPKWTEEEGLITKELLPNYQKNFHKWTMPPFNSPWSNEKS